MIAVKNLCKSFGEHEVLQGITDEIRSGEKVVIIGPSGSGKSTFLRCLNLLELPTSGQVFFDGTEITAPGVDINKVRQQMGMVFQHFNLFPNMTVLRNLTLAPTRLKLMNKEEANEQALKLLQRVNLLDKADAYPAQLSAVRSSESPLFAHLPCGRRLCSLTNPLLRWIPKWSARSWKS